MHPFIAQYENRIRALAPDADLTSARFNGEGLMNDVVFCGERVFRFAKDERRARILQDELLILDRLQPRVPVSIPAPDRRGPDFMTYRLIAGQALRNDLPRTLSESAQQRLAEQLGRFLHALHTTPADGLPPTRAPVTHAAQTQLRREAGQHLYPLLMLQQRDWATHLFDSMLGDPRNIEAEPRLIHGDLWSEHLLVDANAELCGVLDFGMAGLGDPASDVAALLQNYGAAFVGRMQAVYPELQGAVGLLQALAFAAALLLGGLMLTSVAFWFIRVDEMVNLFEGVFAAGRYPVTLYPDWMRAGLTFLVPVAFAVTVPAEALTNRLTPQTLAGAAALTVALFLIARFVWRRGLRAYGGASA